VSKPKSCVYIYDLYAADVIK